MLISCPSRTMGAGSRRVHPHHDLDEGRLARPVVSDERRHLAARHIDGGAAQGLDAAEGHLDVTQRQQHLPRRGGGGLVRT